MRKRAKKEEKARTITRYGIGEWYGKSFAQLTAEDRRESAKLQQLDKRRRPERLCPFRSVHGRDVPCKKEGGVCSLRLYQLDVETKKVSVLTRESGELVTTCPHRFEQAGTVFRQIGQMLLGSADPIILRNVGFLEQDTRGGDKEDVGRIDNVLVHPSRDSLSWCALEIQAVYFSGPGMSKEFKALARSSGSELLFPVGIRRPDYRSSGPKRLMPQLQIKVPTLRRWGKKMAVVVDRSFFDALGTMESVGEISSCDIAWFVVDYRESAGEFVLNPDFVWLTTLERAVEGLTAGLPASLTAFEERIREKLHRRFPGSEAISGPAR